MLARVKLKLHLYAYGAVLFQYYGVKMNVSHLLHLFIERSSVKEPRCDPGVHGFKELAWIER